MTTGSTTATEAARRDASACNDGLGLAPERDALTRMKRLYRLLANGRSVDGYMGSDALAAGIAEIERLRAALEVSQAATQAAVSKAQWQARTNAELNALQDEVRRLRAAACRRLNDEFGA